MKWSLIIIILLIIGLNGCASINNFLAANNVIHSEPKLSPAQAFAKGKQSEKRSQYAKAVSFYLIAAKQGNTPAEMRLGQLYREDHDGVEKDLATSASWFLKAARQGNAFAQYEAGKIYYYGRGVKKGYHQALIWYEKAASHGNTAAQYDLGHMYYNGIGAKRNLRSAFKWYKASALGGDVHAKVSLGYMYLRGSGVEGDIKEAVKWLYSAANDAAWKNISSDNNPSNEARLALASIYENGEGVTKDTIKAFGLIKDASDHGSIKGKTGLARRYMDGDGVVKDLPTAIQLLSEVPENSKYNNHSALVAAVHGALLEGEKAYKQKRYKDALRNLEAAANYGNAKAQDVLGDMYFGGVGIPKNYAHATEWWKKAAGQDDLKAITSLGISYWIGVGDFSRNRDDAIKYLLYAAKKGNKHARYALETLVFPRWHYVTTLNDQVGLIRRDRMRKHHGLVLFLVMSISAPDAIQNEYRFSKYSKLIYQADCENQTIGLRRIFEYASGGKITNSLRHPSIEMQSAVSGSAEEDYLEYVCSVVK